MSDFNKAFNILMKLEFNSPKNALHKNKGENGLTFMGIYQVAHPDLKIWEIISQTIAMLYDSEKEEKELISNVSVVLSQDNELKEKVKQFYKKTFWDRAKLDCVNSQKICEEIFIFGVNVGMRNAIRKAQKLIGAIPDGIVGDQTIEALNCCQEDYFDMAFDEIEKRYYADLISKRPSLSIFERGWNKRADAV